VAFVADGATAKECRATKANMVEERITRPIEILLYANKPSKYEKCRMAASEAAMFQRAFVFILLLDVSGIAVAADVFNISATVESLTNSAGFTTSEDTFDSLKESELNALVPTYTGTEVASADIDFRGLALSVAYPIASAPDLVLNIPSLGITRTFVGATREESRRMLRDFFKDGNVLGRIMRELSEVSPVDPLAGNPNSLQARMITGAFDRNFRRPVSRIEAARAAQVALRKEPLRFAANQPRDARTDASGANAMRSSSVDLGVTASAFRQEGLGTASIDVPFGYAFPPDPARPFSINADVQASDTEGAASYGADVGAAYRFDLNDRWFLAPSANYGVVASEDLGSLGTVVSAALTSAYLLYDGSYSVWMGNAINYSRTLKTSIGDYSFDSKIENVVFVNGLLLSMPLLRLGPNYSIEYSLTDIRYTGTSLYNEYYDEIGLAIGRSWMSGGVENNLKFGVSYLTSENSHGVTLNLAYSF
jgi:hypothetical protein